MAIEWGDGDGDGDAESRTWQGAAWGKVRRGKAHAAD